MQECDASKPAQSSFQLQNKAGKGWQDKHTNHATGTSAAFKEIISQHTFGSNEHGSFQQRFSLQDIYSLLSFFFLQLYTLPSVLLLLFFSSFILHQVSSLLIEDIKDNRNAMVLKNYVRTTCNRPTTHN